MDAQAPEPAREAAARKPGQVRTWWHPLRAGDFQTFLAYALLYRAQNEPLLAPDRLHLLVLAPRLTKPYREELRTLGVTPRQEKPGIWVLEGGVVSHRTWLLETEALAGVQHPMLTLFSPQ